MIKSVGNRGKMLSRLIFIFIIGLIFYLTWLLIFKKTDEMKKSEVLLAKKIIVNSKGVDISTIKPILILNNSLSVKFKVSPNIWHVEAPWDGIVNNLGFKIKLHADIYSGEKVYRSKIVGMAGGINLRFEDKILKNKTVDRVVIFSDSEIEVEDIYLVNLNLK